MKERAARELTPFRRPASACKQAFNHVGRNSKAAVQVQLRSVLPGEAPGSRKEKDEGLVEHFPCFGVP